MSDIKYWPGDLLSTSEAAAVLGLRPSTLDQWRWQGIGPNHIRISPRRIRYLRSDLDEWIVSQRRSSTSDAGDGEQ